MSKSSFLPIYEKFCEERHNALVKFGWFEGFGVPYYIANEIADHLDAMTQEKADAIIMDYFKNNNYAELIKMVARWELSPRLNTRKHIFDEAVASHIQERYYSSATLLAVHIEGIVADYIRCEKTARFKLEGMINDLKQHLNRNLDRVNFPKIDQRLLFEFLEDVYNTRFWHEDPSLIKDPDKNNGAFEASHNLSRNKIAHGHVIIGLTEADSLKCFLYIHELFHLFVELDRGGDLR